MSKRHPDTKPLYDTPHAKAVSEAGGVLVYGPRFKDCSTGGVWHLVVSTGLVHGVYGKALREEAETKAQRIPMAYVSTYVGPRPHVGEQVPGSTEALDEKRAARKDWP